MRRRHLIQGAVSAFVVPPAAWAAAIPLAQAVIDPPGYFFYDDRFAEARRLAAQCPPTSRPISVRGDVTGIWNDHLRRACVRAPVSLEGVTTESFYFCIKRMVQSVSREQSRASRIDRDLYRWVIRSAADRYGVTGI